ncbi:DUF4381 domain-containing protein [Labilibacter marinus]|uniref:DUF4381 domain-containing protein n=1 Tax=Labilibacter marinus TaxID=1477105 RepID=UPI000950111D|nr:DUF4381 domain-containing protein [Labilibacter marinus]
MVQSENIQLNPIIEATPAPFTMDAIGWKILLGILICTIVYFLYKQWLQYKRNAYRRNAITNIQKIALSSNLDLWQLIAQTMLILKRTALITYDRKMVASKEGDEWLHFLDASLKDAFFIKHKEQIMSAVYKNKIEQDFNKNEFTQASINWIKRHA